MAAEVIDTLEIAYELRQAGLPEPQADAIARQFKKRYEADRHALVTRDYLDAAIAELRTEIASIRAEIARLERDLILKLGGIVTVAVAVGGALGVLF